MREVQTQHSHIPIADQSQCEGGVNVRSSVLESCRNGWTQTT